MHTKALGIRIMAGKSPSKSCQRLLLKLQKGQDDLKRSIENIKPPGKMAATTLALLSKRKLESRCRDSLTIDLTRTSHLPRKRARLQQLTPEYEVGEAGPVALVKHSLLANMLAYFRASGYLNFAGTSFSTTTLSHQASWEAP